MKYNLLNERHLLNNYSWNNWTDSYSYDSEIDCYDHNCDSICRCRKIFNAKVDDYVDDAFSVLIHQFDNKKIKQINPQLNYILDRIVATFKLGLGSSYEIITCNGYYGEEIDSVTPLEIHTLEKLLQQIDALPFTDDASYNWKIAVEFTLNLEYNFLLEEIANDLFLDTTLCSVQKLALSDIKKMNTKYLMSKKHEHSYYSLSTTCLKDMIDNHKIMGVVLNKNGVLRLIDGYHRFVELLKLAPDAQYDYLVITL